MSVRWVSSSYRTVKAVWTSYAALNSHFSAAANDTGRDSRERAKYSGLLKTMSSKSFLLNLGLMCDALSELKNLSELLQERDITLPKADKLMKQYILRIESMKKYPGEYFVKADTAIQDSQLFNGVSLVDNSKVKLINKNQFLQSLVDNLSVKLFTCVSSKTNEKTTAERQEQYRNLIEQLDVLNIEENLQSIEERPMFGENEVKALSTRLRVNQRDSLLGYVDMKMSAGRQITHRIKPLLRAVNTLPASNSDCERGFSAQNLILTDIRNRLSIEHVSDLITCKDLGPPLKSWDPLPYVKSWLSQGQRHADSTACMIKRNNMMRAGRHYGSYCKRVWVS